MFLDDRSALNASADAAGFQGTLPEKFVLTGHSAGGGFATAVAGCTVDNGAADDLLGVVMFDGVSSNGTFAPALAKLDTLAIPVYQIAAPPQPWNADGQTTDDLVALRPGQFTGVVLANGSHVDSLIGGVPLIDFIAQLVIKPSPPGNTAAVYTLGDGWINDMYAGKGPSDPQYGLYGVPGQLITLGPATAIVLGVDSPIARTEQLAVATQTLAAPTATTTGPTLINVIGTAAWNLLDVASKILAGPPSVPADSSVTVGRSELAIDGYTAEADWYYPKSGTPDKFIYFQHGFPARAGFYNLTAAELAERNNAIVVAPSITGNIFAADGYSLGADPMHEAVAGLFEGDREALKASALAAGYEGDLPEKFVIAGHSGGGQLAAGAAGYYYDSLEPGEESDLVGVLLYDTSATGGALERALDKLPPELPVLHIAAEPSAWDTFGNASDVLVAKRPDQFNGVQLIGGTHSDAFRSSTLFGLLQPLVALGTGASTPENVEAVQLLSQGWITDMYAGTVYADNPATPLQGIYGTPGTVIDLPNGASAYVLPGPPVVLSPIDRVILTLLSSINANQFVTCASGSGASTPSCTPAIAA